MAKRIREKALARAENADKRPRAVASYVRISPYKVRIVLDVIRGANYMDALAILAHTPKAASKPVKKLIESAGANAENNLNLSKDDLFVAEAYANEGPTLKRWWPRSHGSADTILKRTSHITIILDEISADAKKANAAIAKPTRAAKAKPVAQKEVVSKATTTKVQASKTNASKPTTEAKQAAKPTVKATAKAPITKPVEKKAATKSAAKPAAKAASKPMVAKTTAKPASKPSAKTTSTKGGVK